MFSRKSQNKRNPVISVFSVNQCSLHLFLTITKHNQYDKCR
nr:MAG TPA: hypothetical protein [Caudoviricetes sp.]